MRTPHPVRRREIVVSLTCALLLLGLAACGGGDGGSASTAPSAGSQLTIRVWPNGKGAGHARRWTLTCHPTGGTLPDPVRACARLEALDDPFAPIPKGVACTQVYGGPDAAEVVGTYRGTPLSTRFSRTDGCKISRWDDVSFLFVTSP